MLINFIANCGKIEMKLHFEPDLEYQMAAIEAVCKPFRARKYAVRLILKQLRPG